MDGSYQILGGIKCERRALTAILAVPTSQVSEGTPTRGKRADKRGISFKPTGTAQVMGLLLRVLRGVPYFQDEIDWSPGAFCIERKEGEI